MTMSEVFLVPSRWVAVGNSPPWMTVLAVIAVIIAIILWILARVKSADDARKRRAAQESGHDVGAFQGEGFEGHSAAAVQVPPEPTVSASTPDRDAVWHELFQTETSAQRLAQIAGTYPEFAARIAEHPNAYAELKAWAAGQQTST